MTTPSAYEVTAEAASPLRVMIFASQTQANHRAMVVQTMCELEFEMAQLLFAFFSKQGTNATWEQAENELFGDAGLLGSLSRMVKLSRYLALTDNDEAHDLMVLARLRNMYAHGRDRKQFYEDPKTSSQVEKLILYRNSPALSRHDHQGIYSSCFNFLRARLQEKRHRLSGDDA